MSSFIGDSPVTSNVKKLHDRLGRINIVKGKKRSAAAETSHRYHVGTKTIKGS